MLTTEQLHRDVVHYGLTKRLAGYAWTDIEASVWRHYLYYGLSYAHELHDWIEEARTRAARSRRSLLEA